MLFQYGEWVIEVDIEATKKHYEILKIQFSDIPSYRKYADTQVFRNYNAYCDVMPSEEKRFFDALGIVPELSRVLGFRMDKECNYFVHGNYFVIGRIVNKPSDNIWNEKPDICIGKYQLTILHSEWLRSELLGNIPAQSICINFRAKEIPWLLEEECEQKYYGLPNSMNTEHIQKREHELENVLKSIKSDFRKLTEQETRDYMRQWFERVVPENKREEAKKHCFSNPMVKCYLWHAFSYGFTPYLEESQAMDSFNTIDHAEFALIMNNEKIGFMVENGQGLTSTMINTFNDIYVTDTNFKWTYVHTHEPTFGPYFSFST